jgi:GTP-binding protein
LKIFKEDKMDIKSANFVVSNTDYKKCPTPNIPEYAFIGRSNVGKSSLINMLTNFSKLAKISGRPGKTQLINHFLINENWYLVDLPGYGYAKVSKKNRNKWQEFIQAYLIHRENLYCLFILVDSRLEPQQIDIDFINWVGEKSIPFAIAFTKADKLSKNQLASNVAAFKKELLKSWGELPTQFITSSTDKVGRDEILNFIDEVNHAD